MRPCGSTVVAGILALAAGVAFLLHELELLELGPLVGLLEWWPLALVVVGVAQLARGHRLGGTLWILAGAILQITRIDVVRVAPWELFWPAVLVVVGGALVHQAWTSPELRIASVERFNIAAFWSGNTIRERSPAFAGGSATAVMGGCEIDLRDAELGDGDAVIHLFAMWGGTEIKVPPHWTIVDEVVPVLGGTTVPANPLAEPDRRLVIKGLAVMGGVEVST